MSGITVTRRADRLVAVKRSTVETADRRRAEAEVLAGVAHPGVVEYIELVEGETPDLHLAYVGTDTWERNPPTTATAMVAGLGTVIDTVADLHGMGIAHGALVPEHVVVTADRRPVLCGFADSTTLDPLTEADDLSAVAGLIRTLASITTGPLRARLDELADDADDGRVDARTLSDALRTLPHAREVTSRRRVPSLRRVGVAGAFLAVAVLLGLRLAPDGADAGPEPSAPVSPPTNATTPASTVPAPTAPPTTRSPATQSATAVKPPTTVEATTDEPLEFIHDGRRVGLGRTGDIVVLGDWNCDGTDTPALLRPDDGTVAMFDAWPEPGGAIEAAGMTVVAGARDLQVDESDDCDHLRIIEPTGSSLFSPPEVP